ncbi:unnamed protein product [Rhizoctonia solani]|nr:unnamed protein product [Rhizoctonia solani]
MSWIATRLRGPELGGKSVSPMVFNFFWLFVCGIIIFAIGITTEILLFVNTDSQNVWSFGSLLALILLVVPTETFVGEAYSMMVPDELRYGLRTTLGTHRKLKYEIIHQGQEESLSQDNSHPFISMPEPEARS